MTGYNKPVANKQATIRAFIALALPDAVKAALQDVIVDLSDLAPPRSVRWVKPPAMHLTLRFLGETSLVVLPALSTALDTVAGQHAAFDLQLAGLGCFPNCKRPRVIWAGVDTTPDPRAGVLATLKAEIDAALVPLGWEAETKPFHPHLTLGRVKDAAAVSSIQWQANIAPVRFAVTAIHLIESQLLPEGPRYTVRHTTHLAASGAS